MRRFGTQGRVYPEQHYIVSRTEDIGDFLSRIKEGRYIVLFAPRQTGKTTFFRMALKTLTNEDTSYFPIQLNFETYKNLSAIEFYEALCNRIRKEIELVFEKRKQTLSEKLFLFLSDSKITNHISMMDFFEKLSSILNDEHGNQKVVVVIDEFDGIPQLVLSDFLHSLRDIYLSDQTRCIHSVGIVGVKSITQLNYDRSVSPFKIQDEFLLPNFTLQQVEELLAQYTDEMGQPFLPEVIEALHKQTAGQPFLVNRFSQILTEELDISNSEIITTKHFAKAHIKLLRERNTNIDYLITNIRRDRRFETLLMKIASYDKGIEFNLYNELISELATFGVIAEGPDGMCEIVNPIYQYCIIQAFQPLVNGLEGDYFPENNDTEFTDFLTTDGKLEIMPLLTNFQEFIARAGYRILDVPDTPKEFIGQYLLYAYLEQFVRIVRGLMYLEVQTGRGRIDLLILHNSQKYVIETKIWESERRYQAGKRQLAAYLKLEGVAEGYYVVFDHRTTPQTRRETDMIDGCAIQSYVIPVVQERPSSV